MMRSEICLSVGLLVASLTASAARAVDLTGNRAFEDQELMQVLFDEGLSSTLLHRGGRESRQRSCTLLESFYRDHGYILARVTADDSGPRFQIIEGPRVSSSLLRISGNLDIPDKRIRRAFGSPSSKSGIDQGLDRIRELYEKEGFLLAEVRSSSPQVIEQPDNPWWLSLPTGGDAYRALLNLEIREGPRFRYGAIRLPIPAGEISVDVPETGSFYNDLDLNTLRQGIFHHYRERGTFLTEFRIQPDLDPARHTVDLRISFRVLPRLTVQHIDFSGHSVFPDAFYRREMTFQEGDVLDPHALARSLENLRATGVLESIAEEDAEILVEEQKGAADLLIHLQERDRQGIAFSLDPGRDQNLEMSLFYSVFNLLGLEETLGLNVATGSSMSEFAVAAMSRHLLGTALPVDIGMRLFTRSTGIHLPGPDRRLQRLLLGKARGAAGSARFHFRDGNSLSLAGRVETVLEPSRGKHFLLTPGWEMQTASHRFQNKLAATQHFSFFKGTAGSWDWRSDAGWQGTFRRFPLPDARNLRLRAQASHKVFSGEPVRISQRIFLDPEEIRGFSWSSAPWSVVEKELLPAGADTKFSFGSDFEYPIHPSCTLVPFFDSGVLLTTVPSRSLQSVASTSGVWRSSLGSEIRIRLSPRIPVPRIVVAWNPLRLDKTLSTPGGLSRLRDPAFALRFRY